MQTIDVKDDADLLREYATRNSEAAFETLVSRRIQFVYSTALRQVRDPHLAEEVTQAVFIILARKCGRLRDGTVLTGWLFKTIRFAAIAQARTAARRRQYETEAQMHCETHANAPEPFWDQIAPLLDEGLAQLGEKDRQAILLRYFESKSLAAVGGALKTGEDSARMRISRALEKLRRYFANRGVDSTAELIAGAISANSLQAVPVGLASTITATVIKGSAVAAPILTLVKGTFNIMAWLKTKTAIALGVGTLIAGAAVLTLHEQEQKVRDEEETIRAEENQIRQQEQQANLSPDQKAQLEKRLNQLRAQQNKLRAKQDQLSEQEPNPFSRRSQQLSPFTRVQYEGDKVIVTYKDADCQLTAINDIPVPQMLAFCKANYNEDWQKRFAEDLVVVMAQMGHPVDGDKAKLSLWDPTTGKAITVDNAELTRQNRQSVSFALRRDGIVKPTN